MAAEKFGSHSWAGPPWHSSYKEVGGQQICVERDGGRGGRLVLQLCELSAGEGHKTACRTSSGDSSACRRFSHIHVDIVGPLPVSSGGFSHLLTIADQSTKWVEAVPLRSTSAVVCTEALVATWIARFGIPALMTSERGVAVYLGALGYAMQKTWYKAMLHNCLPPQV